MGSGRHRPSHGQAAPGRKATDFYFRFPQSCEENHLHIIGMAILPVNLSKLIGQNSFAADNFTSYERVWNYILELLIEIRT